MYFQKTRNLWPIVLLANSPRRCFIPSKLPKFCGFFPCAGDIKLSRTLAVGRNILCPDWRVRRGFCSENREDPDSSTNDIMDLKEVMRKLNGFAPCSLAGSWDNVGLLVEPSPPHSVTDILLTNDLTQPVLDEAIQRKVNMILSYHPPIFTPLKRLTQSSWKERLMVKCIEHQIAVYSPHTAYDAVDGGVNDWLIKPFGSTSKPLETVQSPAYPTAGGHRVEITLPADLTDAVQTQLSSLSTVPGVTVVAHIKLGDSLQGATRLCLNCTENGLSKAVAFINQYEQVRETMEIMRLSKPPVPGNGPGRFIKMEACIPVHRAVAIVKDHLGLTHVRLATAVGANSDSPIKTVAVCAGSGSSVLRGVKADLYITGEMSHHDVLHANHSGTNVILCDHSNTERGYFPTLKEALDKIFEGKILIHLSTVDRDPLEIV